MVDHKRIDRWIRLLIALKVVGGQCDYIFRISPRGMKATWQTNEKNEIITVDYVAPVRRSGRDLESMLNLSSLVDVVRDRVGFAHIHRVLMSRISLMQMRTIPTVMSGITFKFIGSRRYDREKTLLPPMFLLHLQRRMFCALYIEPAWYFRIISN